MPSSSATLNAQRACNASNHFTQHCLGALAQVLKRSGRLGCRRRLRRRQRCQLPLHLCLPALHLLQPLLRLNAGLLSRERARSRMQ